MSVPTSRDEFREYCLRTLGKPVIEINVDLDQAEDRIDEALKWYWDYHFSGSEIIYYKQLITQENIDSHEIVMPENIFGVVRIFPLSENINSGNFFSVQYQIALNDLYTLAAPVNSITPYYMSLQHLQLLKDILVGTQPIRYNRHRNILTVDMNWDKVNLGEFLVIEAYQVIDPELYSDVWSDRWLQRYATQLIKRQWGSNLSKFEGMQLPGGVTFNGSKLYEEAEASITKLEDELIHSYSVPLVDMIG